jgi:ribosomal protein L29
VSPSIVERNKIGNKVANALRALDEQQLNSVLVENCKQLFFLRMQSAADRLETPSEISKTKKQIARIHTIHRERQGSTGRDPRIERGELLDLSIANTVLSWIEGDREKWANHYFPLRKILSLAENDAKVSGLHPEEIALALEDLVRQGRMARMFLLIRPSGETVPGRQYARRKDVPLNEAKRHAALVTPGYSLKLR